MFLRECIRYDESARQQELMEDIIRIQRDARCVRRAAWLMAILIALAVFGLGYGMILVKNFPYNVPQFIVNIYCVLVASWLFSIVAFAGLGMIYRLKLNRRREECRQIVTKLLESRLDKPVANPLQDTRVQVDARQVQGPAGTTPDSLTGGFPLGSKS
jgi:hypothetical protein